MCRKWFADMTTATRLAPAPAIIHRSASFAPASFDSTDDSLEVIWTTGAPVQRYSFFGGTFVETLEVSPKAIRLDRLNAGAAVLDSHDMYELAAAIGSVVPGSARIANGVGTCRIRLSDAPDVADTVRKIKDGHLRSVSVGYVVNTYERLAGDDDEPDELRAIDWEPIEISFVTVPADPGAQVRSGSNDMTRIIEGGSRRTRARASAAPVIINRDGAAGSRDDEHEETTGRSQDQERDEGAHLAPRQHASRTRAVSVDRIRAMCARANFSRQFEQELVDQHADEPMMETELLRAINDRLVADRSPIDAREGEIPGQRGGAAEMRSAMEDAIFSRLSGRAPSDAGREFMGVRMIDMARGLMEARGERVRWMSAPRLVDAMARSGAHTTSDFPHILGNAVRRYLLTTINDYPSPLKPITRPRTALDFRSISLPKLGVNPSLLLVPENAEFKRGSVVEAAEGYSLNTYGRIFAITRQALINDDLGAFASVFQGWARAAAELEAEIIAGLIINNPVMSDGNALYSSAHGNIAGSGSAISVASLGAARMAMRLQKDLDGITPVSATPKYLVVGAAKETEAEQVLTQLTAATVSDANPFPGRLTLLVDPRLPGNAWRLFAEPGAWPVVEIARLEGQEDVFVESRVGFDVDGVETKARVDIGGAAVDWRGTYMNPGD